MYHLLEWEPRKDAIEDLLSGRSDNSMFEKGFIVPFSHRSEWMMMGDGQGGVMPSTTTVLADSEAR